MKLRQSENSPYPEISEDTIMQRLLEKEPNQTDLVLRLEENVKQFRNRIETTIQVLIYAFIAAIWTKIMEKQFAVTRLEFVILLSGAVYQMADIICLFLVYNRLKTLPESRRKNESSNVDAFNSYQKTVSIANMFLIFKIFLALLVSIFFIIYVVTSLKILE